MSVRAIPAMAAAKTRMTATFATSDTVNQEGGPNVRGTRTIAANHDSSIARPRIRRECTRRSLWLISAVIVASPEAP